VFDYDRNLLLSSFVEAVCCDVFYVPLHSANGKLFFFSFFLGLLFFSLCEVLLNVSSRSVFSFFIRGSLDDTALQSVTVQKLCILQ